MISTAFAPVTATTAGVGWTWIPYLLGGLALVAVAVIARIRSRSREAATLAEFLMIRGSAIMLIGILVFLLADAAAEGDGLTAVDRPIWSWFVDHRTGALTVAAKIVTTLGSTVAIGALALITVVALALRRPHRGEAALVATVSAGAGLLVAVSKPIVGRVRPPVELRLVTETNASFPSGHALASVAILGVLAVVLVPVLVPAGSRLRTGVIAVLAVFALLIGLSRLYLGVHWSTDVAGGWLIGAGWLLICLTVRRLWRTYPVVLGFGRRTLLDHRLHHADGVSADGVHSDRVGPDLQHRRKIR